MIRLSYHGGIFTPGPGAGIKLQGGAGLWGNIIMEIASK